MKGMEMETDEYREYWFEVTGKVYATSPSHAKHFVYWAIEEALAYGDASNGSIRVKEVNVDGDDNE